MSLCDRRLRAIKATAAGPALRRFPSKSVGPSSSGTSSLPLGQTAPGYPLDCRSLSSRPSRRSVTPSSSSPERRSALPHTARHRRPTWTGLQSPAGGHLQARCRPPTRWHRRWRVRAAARPRSRRPLSRCRRRKRRPRARSRLGRDSFIEVVPATSNSSRASRIRAPASSWALATHSALGACRTQQRNCMTP